MTATNGHAVPSLPATIAGVEQWINCRMVPKEDGKLAKVPSDLTVNPPVNRPEDQNIDHLDPENWLDLTRAATLATGQGHGIGFVLHPDNLIVVLDLDGCRDPLTGKIEKWAWKIIRRFDSYTEVSPSGTGVHIWVRGAITGTMRPMVEGHEIEWYSQDRFMTVTAERVEGTPAEIRPRQQALNELLKENRPTESPSEGYEVRSNGYTDDEAIEKRRSFKNAEKFSRLFDHGDIDTYHRGDDSVADMALAAMLAFVTGPDPEQIERIMRRSALSRRKWDDHRTYLRELTINNVLKGMDPDTDFHHPKKSSRHSHSLIGTGMLGMNKSTNVVNLQKPLQAVSLGTVARPKPRRWVVENLIPRGHMSLIYGEGGKAKSYLALDLAFNVAVDDVDTWLGYNIVTGPVLYLDFELDQGEQARRAHDLAAGKGLDKPPENLLYLGALGYTAHEAFQAAYEAVKEHGVELVVIDSLGLALQGDAESSTDVIGFVREHIDPLRATGAAILAVDHQAKRIKGDRYGDKTAFGSVYKTNLARSVIQVDGTWDGAVLTADLVHKKTNFGPRQSDIHATVKFDVDRVGIELSYDFGPREPVEEADIATDKVLKVLRERGPMYNADIAVATGIDPKTVSNRVSDMVRSGLLEHTGNKNGNAKEVRATSTSHHDSQDVPPEPNPGQDDGLGAYPDRGVG